MFVFEGNPRYPGQLSDGPLRSALANTAKFHLNRNKLSWQLFNDIFTYGLHIEFKTSTKMKGNLIYGAVQGAEKTGFRRFAGARSGIGMGLSQTGQVYGEGITNEVAGPFKGEPGTAHW